MCEIINELFEGKTPFCLIQKQDSEEVLVLKGDPIQLDTIETIPRKKGIPDLGKTYDTISIVPYSQIKEKGYNARDDGEKILCIQVTQQTEIWIDQLMAVLPDEEIEMKENISYDTTEDEYGKIIRHIVEDEIGNGEGANFVIPRNAQGKIKDFNTKRAFTIFKSLLKTDYGTYWKFIFFNGERFFVGSTPERHLYAGEGRVKMNPISGTFRKDRQYKRRREFKEDILSFLKDQKEINELFMVVDEELKMMAKMCDKGGTIVGPLLKEMSQLIHSEYLLSGISDKDIFELFKDSMFAATVVGSPVENACNIIKKYSDKSRRYYGSAMMLIGRDEEGHDFLDSPITIRTAEIDLKGELHFSVGATLVKDSIPEDEVKETQAKGSALLGSIISAEKRPVQEPLLVKLYNDDDINETLVQRNQNLSNFWFFKQEKPLVIKSGTDQLKLTMIHNEDDFVYMLQHIFSSFGIRTTIISFKDYHFERDTADITLVGPGPGNPNDNSSSKINLNLDITQKLLNSKRKALFICLGHQILCRTLGFQVDKKAVPLQGAQEKINLFGEEEFVGFYNTFVPKTSNSVPNVSVSSIPESNEVVAIKGESFIGYQFHPESILTKNGYSILKDSIQYLMNM